MVPPLVYWGFYSVCDRAQECASEVLSSVVSMPSRDNTASRPGRHRRTSYAVGALVLYVLIAALYAWPLLSAVGSAIPGDAGDPALNASILLWNASVTPFSAAWWNAPHFYPTADVAAFTENLVGISPISSPIIWVSGNLLLAYNVALFLSWPLSAWTTYLLVLFVARRHDAALLAGLAYALSPYRMAEFAHIQMLSTQWLPLVFLGLHGYLADRRRRWLVLFGVAWLLTSLSNGHFMLFGAVLIGLWLAYFTSRRSTWVAACSIIGAWTLASLPLLPVMLKYREVHERFGLFRNENEILAFSAQPSSWAHVSSTVWFWRALLPDAKDDLFPGMTALVILSLGIGLVLWRRRRPAAESSASRRRIVRICAVVTGLSAVATLVALCVGPWTATVGGAVLFRMRDLNRALMLIAVCGTALVLMTRSTREALERRSPLVFYTAATLVCASLCLGPILRVGEAALLSPMPYRWLMALPGFHEVRVPPRFWMLGTLCLAAAAGLAFCHLRPAREGLRRAAFVVAAVGVLLDGWVPALGMAKPPEVWSAVETTDSSTPILELPIGPAFDYAATFRASAHRRRVVNGVSGYNPPHYIALVVGLQARDPLTLAAIASRGPVDVVVNDAADLDGAFLRFVSEFPGATQLHDDRHRVAYRIPQSPPEPSLGAPLPIRSVHAVRYDDAAALMHDGKLDTGWGDFPQKPDQWVMIDLGEVREVGGLTHTIGDFFLDYPRRLIIDVSSDGRNWDCVWDAPTMGPMVLASIRAPRVTDMRFAFAPHAARFVRLRQVERARTMWRISELQVHAPAKR